jgi:histidinol dehydrogenase
MRYLKRGKEREEKDNKELTKLVEKIIEEVRINGDKAIACYSKKFDNSFRDKAILSKDEIKEAYESVDQKSIDDIRFAADNIRSFAKAQRSTVKELYDFSPIPGVVLGHKIIPVESCCCYVPGGNFPLYSTALMLGIPAKEAGVKRIVACSPVERTTGKINPKTIVAMDIAGIDEIYAIGGVQAVAAFTYGTDEIEPVNIIVGPGNQYVTEAKRQCYGKVGIDFLAGPSEVLVIADENANPEIIAADLIAQSEHDVNAKGILVTTSEDVGKKTMDKVLEQLGELKNSSIAELSWNSYGEVILAKDIDEAIIISNDYAPEHLEINIKDPELVIDKLINYGSLFIGENTAEVFGDYASGTNHTLPTLKASRYTGGVWVGTFLKTCTFQKLTNEGRGRIAPVVKRLAMGEGLEGHAMAAKKRIE